MTTECDELVFSSGRRERVNGGIVGIGPDLETSGGYDDGLPLEEDYPGGLTDPECIELADAMIQRWEAFKQEARKRLLLAILPH